MASLNAKQRSSELYSSLEQWLGPKPGSVLDVGGRNGELMEGFSRKGHSVSVLDMDGGEPSDKRITKIRMSFLQHSESEYDLITMLHILEHTESPKAFLLHARHLMKENGLIFIEVPSELMTPLIFRHIGDHRHLGYFTKTTLRAFLESCGFTCLTCKLEIGFVGAALPVIKVIARKLSTVTPWKPSRFMVIRSIVEVLHPLPFLVRVVNALRIKTFR